MLKSKNNLLVFVLSFFGIACAVQPEKPTKKLPPIPLEIEITRIKLVHFNNPDLTDQQIKAFATHRNITTEPHSVPRGIYFTCLFKNRQKQPLEIDVFDFNLQPTLDGVGYSGWKFNEKGYSTNSPMIPVVVPADSFIYRDFQLTSIHYDLVGALVDSSELEIFFSLEDFSTAPNAYRFVYAPTNKNNVLPKIIIFTPDSIPTELWYSRDFRTYTEAKAYGLPFLLPDSIKVEHKKENQVYFNAFW